MTAERPNRMSEPPKKIAKLGQQNWLGDIRPRYFTKYTILGIPYLIVVGGAKVALKVVEVLLYMSAIMTVSQYTLEITGLPSTATTPIKEVEWYALGVAAVVALIRLCGRYFRRGRA